MAVVCIMLTHVPDCLHATRAIKGMNEQATAHAQQIQTKARVPHAKSPTDVAIADAVRCRTAQGAHRRPVHVKVSMSADAPPAIAAADGVGGRDTDMNMSGGWRYIVSLQLRRPGHAWNRVMSHWQWHHSAPY